MRRARSFPEVTGRVPSDLPRESTMPDTSKPLAIVTGASTGIGYELAKLCA